MIKFKINCWKCVQKQLLLVKINSVIRILCINTLHFEIDVLENYELYLTLFLYHLLAHSI